MSKISARTSSAIVQICAKGEAHKNAVIDLTDKIMKGKIGHEKLAILVSKKVNGNTTIQKNQIFADKDLIFTIKDKNKITIELSNKFSHTLGEKNKIDCLIKKLKNLYYEILDDS